MERKFLCTGLCLLTVAAFLCGTVGTAVPAATPAKSATAPAKSVAAPAKPAAAPAQFKIINPRPSKPPIMAIALSPRLPNLAGKTIAVIANYDPAMAPIAGELPKVIKDAKVLFISDLLVAAGQTPHSIQLEAPGVTNMLLKDFEKNPKVADAIIVGNGF
jgi:hypothetical protein